MRGVSEAPLLSTDSFIIIDRLLSTLEKKIRSWHETHEANSGFCCGISANKKALHELLKTRLLVAFDLASALDYLHSHRYVYNIFRNVGFLFREPKVTIFFAGLSMVWKACIHLITPKNSSKTSKVVGVCCSSTITYIAFSFVHFFVFMTDWYIEI